MKNAALDLGVLGQVHPDDKVTLRECGKFIGRAPNGALEMALRGCMPKNLRFVTEAKVPSKEIDKTIERMMKFERNPETHTYKE